MVKTHLSLRSVRPPNNVHNKQVHNENAKVSPFLGGYILNRVFYLFDPID